MLFIANSLFDEIEARAFADAEWQTSNEPRLSTFEATISDQASRLEVAVEEKSKVADLRAKLLKAEEKVAELEVANFTLNIAWDEPVASQISI